MPKICISLPEESFAMLEYLRAELGLSPNIKRSTLIQQVIFDAYTMRMDSHAHFTSLCQDDCWNCVDAANCDYSEHYKEHKHRKKLGG